MKGFTLIELLAVLVILAIILLIAFPLISNVILGVKRDAFESSVKLIVKAAEQDYMKRNLEGDNREVEYKFNDFVQTVTPADVAVLDVNGTLPKEGIITVYPDGGVEVKVSDGEFYTDTNGNGQVNEPVVYVPETHDPLLSGTTAWVFEVTIPSGGDTFSFGAKDANLTINWGDGAETTHTYAGKNYINHSYAEGVYNVTLTGTSSHISFCTLDDFGVIMDCPVTTPWYLTDVLTEIPVSMGLTSTHSMFVWVEAVDFTSLNFFDKASANVTDMSYMFADTDYFNHPVGNFDTSKVTNMKGIFYSTEAFNQPLTNWNTSNVTDMSYMFSWADVFDQPLTNFNTSKVTTMSNMFDNAKLFNQSISHFDTSNVTDMADMLSDTNNFNQPINNWDTSKVTNMAYMFQGSIAFNQNINNWNTSNVTNMESMFYGANLFNQPLDNWDTSKVTIMGWMFDGATAFNQNINNWNTSNVTNMSGMFYSANSFNQPLNNWNISKVTNVSSMFNKALSFNQDISSWNTSSVTNMLQMFWGTPVFNQNIASWNTGNVTDMRYMFQNATAFNRSLSSWCVSKIAAKPTSFDAGATAWVLAKPIWGTCP